MKTNPSSRRFPLLVLFTLGLTAAAALAASCPYCGRYYPPAAPGDEYRVNSLRRSHEASCASRPRGGGSSSSSSSGPTVGEVLVRDAIKGFDRFTRNIADGIVDFNTKQGDRARKRKEDQDRRKREKEEEKRRKDEEKKLQKLQQGQPQSQQTAAADPPKKRGLFGGLFRTGKDWHPEVADLRPPALASALRSGDNESDKRNYEAAAKWYREALRIDPDSDEAREKLEKANRKLRGSGMKTVDPPAPERRGFAGFGRGRGK